MAGGRAGARRGAKPKKSFSPALLGLALGVTALVIAWGYLVYAAIDFGASARGGRGQAWWFLGLASLGAVACLFAGLMLVARILRLMGITADPVAAASQADDPVPYVGAGAGDGVDTLAPRAPGRRRAGR